MGGLYCEKCSGCPVHSPFQNAGFKKRGLPLLSGSVRLPQAVLKDKQEQNKPTSDKQTTAFAGDDT
jgi:hypothetical protein